MDERLQFVPRGFKSTDGLIISENRRKRQEYFPAEFWQ